MFDMMLLDRPCLIYAPDIEKYDRGYYFNFKDLPFPLATSQEELVQRLKAFDIEKYKKACKDFDDLHVRFVEKGEGCKAIAEWMKKE